MFDGLPLLGAFVGGYLLGTWTFVKASGQKWVIWPGVSHRTHEPAVVDTDEEVIAGSPRARRDRVDGLGA